MPRLERVGNSQRLNHLTSPRGWSDAGALEQQIYLILGELDSSRRQALQEVEDELEDFGTESPVIDLKGLFKIWPASVRTLRFFMKMEDETTVYWLGGKWSGSAVNPCNFMQFGGCQSSAEGNVLTKRVVWC